MSRSHETTKRAGSMGHLALVGAKRLFWGIDCLVFYLAAFSCLLIMLGFAGGVLRFAPWPLLRDLVVTPHIWLLLLLPMFAHLCVTGGNRCFVLMQQSNQADRLGASAFRSLSSRDSLMRASQEPIQAQQAVLLRAATGSVETPDEQLVRPAGGQGTKMSGEGCY